MHENFERQGILAGRERGALGGLDVLDLGEGVFAGEHDEFGAEIAGEVYAGFVGDGHLSRAVDGKVGRESADEAADADVLHDGGIHAGGDDGAEIVGSVVEFVSENESVKGDVATHAATVQEGHEFGQVGDSEVVRPHTGVEALKAEEDGVGPVLHCGAGALPVAGRCEQFGARKTNGSGRGGGSRLRNGSGHEFNEPWSCEPALSSGPDEGTGRSTIGFGFLWP